MSIQLNVPEGLNIGKFELSMFLASRLFEEGLISSGQGAKMVGLSKHAFIEMLGKYKVSIFQYDINEIEEDIANA